MKTLLLGVASALLLCEPAGAAVLTYDVSGQFVNNSVLSGHFSFDPAGSIFSQFTNIDLIASGVGEFKDIGSVGGTFGGPPSTPTIYSLGLFSGTNALQISFEGVYDSALVLSGITGNTLAAGSTLASINGTEYFLKSGTITRADAAPAPKPTSAVPEPASWALMIAGFGLVGGSLRKKRIREGKATA